MLMTTAASADCSEAKSALRKEVFSARRHMTSAEKADASAQVCAQLMRTPAFMQASCVAAFAPMEEEVNIWPVIEECWREGKKVGLPHVLSERKMSFHATADARGLEKGFKNILQPPRTLPQITPQMFDFAIIPAVAVDSCRYRLGYGGGFYDIFMSELDCAAITCATIFRCQRVAEVPLEAHDKQVNMVITE